MKKAFSPSEMDAAVWVKEWMKTIKKNTKVPRDKGTMLSWFANAIMAGWDNHRWRYNKVYLQISNSRTVCGVWMYEPSIEERVDRYNEYMGNVGEEYGEDCMMINTYLETHEVKY